MIIQKNAGTSSQKIRKILKSVLSWGIILLFIPWENRKSYTPAQLGIYGFSGYVHHRLKRGHPGHKKNYLPYPPAQKLPAVW